MDSEIFEKLSPTKLLIRCALPAMVTMAFGALFSVVDGLFVGRFIGEDALAAINLIMPIIMMVEALSNMIATGASVQISILLGQKDRRGASAVFSYAILATLAVSSVLGIFGFFFAEAFVRLLAPGATETAVRHCVSYLRTFSLFSPVFPLFFATDNYLRVCGKERWSMWVSIFSQGLNIVLDFVLIALCGFGVTASALASCISMALGAGVTLFLFARGKTDLYFTREKIPFSRFAKLLANGSSEFFSHVSTSVMMVVMNFFLLRYGGTVAVAAFSVVMYVDSIVGMLIFGLCDSLQPAISYCYGAGDLGKVRAIFRRILVCAAGLSILSMLFMLFLGRFVAPLFVKPEDTDLLALSISAMVIFSFSYLPGWIDMCFSSYFTALERPIRSLTVSLLGTLVFPIFFLFLLTAFWGLDGVWWTPTAAASVSGGITLILAKTLKLAPPEKK